MKNEKLIQLVLLVLLATCYKTKAQSYDQDLLEFNLTSIALKDGKPVKKYNLTLYAEGKIIESIYVKKGSPVNINLKVNQIYTIVYEKDSLPKKIIIINTELPQQNTALQTNDFEFEIELSPDISTQKEEMLDFPVGYVFYERKKKQLVPSDSYHNYIHKSKINK